MSLQIMTFLYCAIQREVVSNNVPLDNSALTAVMLTTKICAKEAYFLFTDSLFLTIVVWIAILVGVVLFYFFIIQRAIRLFVQRPIPAFFARFIDNPVRRRFQPPKLVVDWIDIEEGMWVLEVGPGPGTFTIEAARRVGERGKFFAVDIQQKIISRLDARLKAEGLTIVTTKVAPADNLPFPDNTFDRVFMVSVLGEVPDKHKAISEFKRVLKDDGLLAIGEQLPDPHYPLQRTVIKWCHYANLELLNRHVGIFHYLLTFKKTVPGSA
jgi:SAM-dependent methyltransferase